MDITDWRSLSTVTCFIALLAVFWWAFSPRRKKDFDEAAHLPFGHESDDAHTAKKETIKGEQNS